MSSARAVAPVYHNILEMIGNTPMLEITRIDTGRCRLFVKMESMNPGNSIKDRIAVTMVEDAEKSGKLKKGGRIVEATAGNTGLALALVAGQKGYRLTVVVPDKMSDEKISHLRAMGAEVVLTRSDVAKGHPEYYQDVAEKIARDDPDAFYVNQFANEANPRAHYESTGPEIWEQTEGRVDHLLVGVGTGGTLCGTGRYLKEKKPSVKVWGIDTYGSVFKKYKETGIFDKNEIYPYVTEGIGEDFLPQNVDFDVVDHFEKVTDRDAAIYTREIVRQEGIWAGNSAGSAIAGLLQLKDRFRAGETVVVIFHDHGTRYLGKMFNPAWMRMMGYETVEGPTARDLVRNKRVAGLVSLEVDATVDHAILCMGENDFSQIPIVQNGRVVGSLSESRVYAEMIKDPAIRKEPVKTIMQRPFRFVDIETPVSLLAPMITPEHPAVLVRDFPADKTYILTGHDILKAL